MPKLVFYITAGLEDGHRVAEAWDQAGAPGVTFIESYGLRRFQENSKSFEVLPGVMSMLELLRESDTTTLIVFSVVEDEATVDRLLKVTEGLVGDLRLPHNGIAFVLDVERAIGIRRQQPSK